MKRVKYIGQHSQYGEVFEVEDNYAEQLLKTKSYVNADENVILKNLPKESWTEKKIDEWLKVNNIPIDYEPSKDLKKDILNKIYNYFN